eukprot:1480170-Prymnesium_polylepis.1
MALRASNNQRNATERRLAKQIANQRALLEREMSKAETEVRWRAHSRLRAACAAPPASLFARL